jgi:hypothetical protein
MDLLKELADTITAILDSARKRESAEERAGQRQDARDLREVHDLLVAREFHKAGKNFRLLDTFVREAVSSDLTAVLTTEPEDDWDDLSYEQIAARIALPVQELRLEAARRRHEDLAIEVTRLRAILAGGTVKKGA